MDYRDSESALAPATIVGLLAVETAYNQLLVVSFLGSTLVDLPLPKTVKPKRFPITIQEDRAIPTFSIASLVPIIRSRIDERLRRR